MQFVNAKQAYAFINADNFLDRFVCTEWYASNLYKPFVAKTIDNITKFYPLQSAQIPFNPDWNDISFASITGAKNDIKMDNIAFILTPNTIAKCISSSYRIAFVLDFSQSMFTPMASGSCYLNTAVKCVESIFFKLSAFVDHLEFSESRFVIPTPLIRLTTVAVTPDARCCILLHAWKLNHSEVRSKINQISRKLFKLEQLWAHSPACSKTCTQKRASSQLIDLLRSGAVSVSLMQADSALSSIIILTDGCFAMSDMNDLDRSMSHLRAAEIQCSFILLSSFDLDMSSYNPFQQEGLGLSLALSSGAHLPHTDLCRFVSHATIGFCISTYSDKWKQILNEKIVLNAWNSVHDLVLSSELMDARMHSLSSEGDLHWMSIDEIEPYTKLIISPFRTVFAARIRDGYRLRSVSNIVLSPAKSKKPSDTQSPALTELIGSPREDDRANHDTSQRLFQIELVLAWKPGIIFRYFITGSWPLHRFALPNAKSNLSTLQSGEEKLHYSCNTEDESDLLNLAPNELSLLLKGTHCRVQMKLNANYSFLHDVTCLRKLPVRSHFRVSIINRFVFHFRLLNLVDRCLEDVSSVSNLSDYLCVPEQYRDGILPVFLITQLSGGQQVIQPTSVFQHNSIAPKSIRTKSGESESVDHNSITVDRFIDAWRFLFDLDTAQCYRWLHIKTIFAILEHDSPLPANLHIPLDGKQYTATLLCRQALSQVHSFLSTWCSFVLLENHTYVCLNIDERVKTFVANSKAQFISSTGVDTNVHLDTSKNPLPFNHYFSFIRLEMRLAELKFSELFIRIAFVAGTPAYLRRMFVQILTNELRTLRFPQRGRQAIPKSRHKSGAAPKRALETLSQLPPLQRSWEETPCCTLFKCRLDRLILERGSFTKVVPLKRPKLSPLITSAGHLENNCLNKFLSNSDEHGPSTTLTSQGQVTAYESYEENVSKLLYQHLYRNVCVWCVKSSQTLQMMFSSLVSLRLQEGFHFARAGPQPGFTNLVTEVYIAPTSNSSDLAPQSCLVQYLLYPIWPTSRVSRPHESQFIASQNSTTISIHSSEIPDSTSFVVQVAIELWIEPKDGHMTGLSPQNAYWNGAEYTELAGRIFELDRTTLSVYSSFDLFCPSNQLQQKQHQVSRRSSDPTIRSVGFCQLHTASAFHQSGLDASILGGEIGASFIPTSFSCLARLSPRFTLLLSFSLICDSANSLSPGPMCETVGSGLIDQICEQLLNCYQAMELTIGDGDQLEFSRHLAINNSTFPSLIPPLHSEMSAMPTESQIPGSKYASHLNSVLTNCSSLKWRFFVLPKDALHRFAGLNSSGDGNLLDSDTTLYTIIAIPTNFSNSNKVSLHI
ncbi:unnamed protein product [Protopolystoma xenopodis]|uniref:Uncharacterized protein n=1 Tax=Protopolystoma xenopodis TaxID=117903 RepID=A0A448WEP2_9PLAT|nr:unnamed protein product [Protopolystoma xenopodis]